jgi:putative membrane protein
MLQANLIVTLLIVFVAIIHIFFLVLEMFLWTKAFGLKTFRMTQDKAHTTSVLAKNQGLYNGFLAAGLIWSLFVENLVFAQQVATFFLTCVSAAGIYGALTVNKRILFIQGLPAILGLIAIYIF